MSKASEWASGKVPKRPEFSVDGSVIAFVGNSGKLVFEYANLESEACCAFAHWILDTFDDKGGE